MLQEQRKLGTQPEQREGCPALSPSTLHLSLCVDDREEEGTHSFQSDGDEDV